MRGTADGASRAHSSIGAATGELASTRVSGSAGEGVRENSVRVGTMRGGAIEVVVDLQRASAKC